MNKIIHALCLGLSLVSSCTLAADKPTKKHQQPEVYFEYSTATVTTGVEVTAIGNLCALSATWASKGQFGKAHPDLHTVQLRDGCNELARANVVEQGDNGWQPTPYAWSLYKIGPSAYSDVLKNAASAIPSSQ